MNCIEIEANHAVKKTKKNFKPIPIYKNNLPIKTYLVFVKLELLRTT